jgi:hypothetical protein
MHFSRSIALSIIVLMLVVSSSAVPFYRVEASSAIDVKAVNGNAVLASSSIVTEAPMENTHHAIAADPGTIEIPQMNIDAQGAETGQEVTKLADATFVSSRHVMCKDRDANWNCVSATTVFSPNDAKAGALWTTYVRSEAHTVWYYRHDSQKAWNYYSTATSTFSNPGTYYLFHWVWVSGYTPSTFYPWAWKVDVFIDNNYDYSDFFEITDDGKKSTMCQSVDSNGNCVNEKSNFMIATDTVAYHYLRLDHIAYFNEGTGHVHDFKCEWYAPDGSLYRTYQNWWPDYKDSNLNYDYWGYGYDPYDYISIGSSTPTGTWTVKTYLDQYYDSGWLWYGPIATISFTVSNQPNHTPTLSSGSVDPSSGYPSTTFSFLVKYTDTDGDQAATKRLYVYDNGWGYVDMDHFAGNPIDGEWFNKRLTGFSQGSHNFFFYFTDGRGGEDYDPESGYHSFVVNPDVNNPKIRVDPTSLSFQYPSGASVEPSEMVKVGGSEYQVDVSVTFAGLQVSPDGDNVRVSSEGCDQAIETGYPILPAKSFYLLIPPASMVESYEILYYDEIRLPGPFAIRSAPLPTATPDMADLSDLRPSYGSQSLFPVQVASTGEMHGFRGYRLLSMTFFAGQYLPSSLTLIQINKLTLRVRLVPTDKGTFESLFRGLPTDEKELERIAVNPDVAATYQNTLSTVASTADYKYVIITDSELTGAFQPLADWKTQKIGSATVVTVSSISSSYTGRDTPEKIRNFIKDAYNNWGTRWVLLGGDVEVVPYRGAYGIVQSTSGPEEDRNIPTDLYYSDLDGNWDANGNSIFGEVSDNVDLYPDVYVGRAPVNTVSEATVFVNKVLTYERSPPPGYLLKALLVAYWLDANTNEAVSKDYIAGNYLGSYATTKIYEATSGAGVDTTSVVNTINAGVGVFAHNSHGNYWTTPPFGVSDVDGLNNGDKLFVFYSMACLTNKFEESDAISEHYILNNHGGAVAYIGNSRYGWYYSGNAGNGPSDQYEKEFFRLVHDGYTHVSEVLARSKTTYISSSGSDGPFRWIQYCLNLLGDPEMDIRTQENSLSKSITVYNDGSAVLSVTSTTDHYSSGELTGWLSASPRVYQVSPSSSQKVTVTVVPNGLGAGTYHGWLEIASNDPNNSPVTVTVTLTVNAQPFDFSLDNSGGITVTQGGSGSNTIYVNLASGQSQSVSLSCPADLPSGASCSFNPQSNNPTFNSQLTVSTSSSTPANSYTITVTGSGGGKSHTTQFTLAILSGGEMPDLTVTSIWLENATGAASAAAGPAGVPGSDSVTAQQQGWVPNPGDQFCIWATVQNVGTASAPGYYIDAYYDSTYGQGYTPYALAPGYTENWYWCGFTAQPGIHVTRWIVDPSNLIPESDETNNELDYAFSVGPDAFARPYFHVATEFWFSTYDMKNAEWDAIHIVNVGTAATTVQIYIAGVAMEGTPISIPAGESAYRTYPGVQGSPVHVVSSGQPIWVSQRILGWTAMQEVYGFPGNEASLELMSTWYDLQDAQADDIYLTNPSSVDTATVAIYIAGVQQGPAVTVLPSGSWMGSFPGVVGGPVLIVSDLPVFMSQRVIGWSDFDEILGLPTWYTFKEAWFNWYDMQGASWDAIHMYNPGSTAASVQIYVAGSLVDTLTVAAGGIEYRYHPGLIGGPVHVVSDQPIWVTQRIVGWGGWKELFGISTNLANTQWYFTWYDMKDAQWDAIHFLNLGTQDANVQVYINGQLVQTLVVTAGTESYVTFPGTQNGPVVIVSDTPIIASQRILGWGSFEETLGAALG